MTLHGLELSLAKGRSQKLVCAVGVLLCLCFPLSVHAILAMLFYPTHCPCFSSGFTCGPSIPVLFFLYIFSLISLSFFFYFLAYCRNSPWKEYLSLVTYPPSYNNKHNCQERPSRVGIDLGIPSQSWRLPWLVTICLPYGV